MMIYRLKKLYRPEYYQKQRNFGYFEGWYFKCAFQDHAVAFIPGISLAKTDPHAFVQVNRPAGSSYHRFQVKEFSSRRDRFHLSLGANEFSLDHIHVELPDLTADLGISNPVRWPTKVFAPNSMGWYAFMQVMECYHGIIVLDGEIEGTINGNRHSGGRFYLEKDWGSSFPRAWIWMQTNSFSRPASLTCSLAIVPFRKLTFAGFIIGFAVGSRVFRFASYNGSRVEELSITDDTVSFTVQRRNCELQVRSARTSGMKLASPVEGEMSGRIQESLDAEAHVLLRENGGTLFEGKGIHAGLEVTNPEVLIDEWRSR
jgi:tocopherol cyclase